MTRVRKFQKKETVPIWAETKTWAGVYSSPDQGIKVTVKDPNGVIKAGRISVLASTSFTVGLAVIGGTSGATGIVMEKVDATTLHLQQVAGTWVTGEAITDTGSGTSTTSSALTAPPMTESEAGKFIYYYTLASDAVVGWWRVSCIGQDGLLGDAKYTVAEGGFWVE